jgi:hypothetical protein
MNNGIDILLITEQTLYLYLNFLNINMLFFISLNKSKMYLNT